MILNTLHQEYIFYYYILLTTHIQGIISRIKVLASIGTYCYNPSILNNPVPLYLECLNVHYTCFEGHFNPFTKPSETMGVEVPATTMTITQYLHCGTCWFLVAVR